MVIRVSVKLEEALVAAAGDDGGFADLDGTDPAGRIVRILDGDGPLAVIRFEAKGLDIAAQGDDAAFDTGLAHGADGIFRFPRHSLCLSRRS